MGSRGSDYDDGIKANKAQKRPPLSKAEEKIKNEGMEYPGLPDRGASQSRAQADARKAKDIMVKNANKQIINNSLNSSNPISVRDIVDDKISGLNGGFYLEENGRNTKYLLNELGYASVSDAINDIQNIVNPDDIFSMKYSDTFTPKIAGKTREGQIYEFVSEIKNKQTGEPKLTYVKLMNVHTKSGNTYSIVLSVHEEIPSPGVKPIWEMVPSKQPRYNQ